MIFFLSILSFLHKVLCTSWCCSISAFTFSLKPLLSSISDVVIFLRVHSVWSSWVLLSFGWRIAFGCCRHAMILPFSGFLSLSCQLANIWLCWNKISVCFFPSTLLCSWLFLRSFSSSKHSPWFSFSPPSHLFRFYSGKQLNSAVAEWASLASWWNWMLLSWTSPGYSYSIDWWPHSIFLFSWSSFPLLWFSFYILATLSSSCCFPWWVWDVLFLFPLIRNISDASSILLPTVHSRIFIAFIFPTLTGRWCLLFAGCAFPNLSPSGSKPCLFSFIDRWFFWVNFGNILVIASYSFWRSYFSLCADFSERAMWVRLWNKFFCWVTLFYIIEEYGNDYLDSIFIRQSFAVGQSMIQVLNFITGFSDQ